MKDMKKQLIKELKKFYYAPTDLIPNLDLIKDAFDDEFNSYLYTVYYANEDGRYKFMQDLTQNQQDFINKRFKTLEYCSKIKIDKFQINGNIKTIKEELLLRNIQFKSISIDKKNKQIIILDSMHKAGRVDIDEYNLILDVKSSVRRDCSKYLRNYEVVLKYSDGFINYHF